MLPDVESGRGEDQWFEQSARVHAAYGDISHLSKPEEFDTVDQIFEKCEREGCVLRTWEHDVLNDDGKSTRNATEERQGRGMVQLRQKRRALYRAGERE